MTSTEMRQAVEKERVDAIDLLTVVRSAGRIHDETPDRGWENGMAVLAKQLGWAPTKARAIYARVNALCNAIADGRVPGVSLAMLKDSPYTLPLMEAAAAGELRFDGKEHYLDSRLLCSRCGIDPALTDHTSTGLPTKH